jgi:hypothetical protein
MTLGREPLISPCQTSGTHKIVSNTVRDNFGTLLLQNYRAIGVEEIYESLWVVRISSHSTVWLTGSPLEKGCSLFIFDWQTVIPNKKIIAAPNLNPLTDGKGLQGIFTHWTNSVLQQQAENCICSCIWAMHVLFPISSAMETFKSIHPRRASRSTPRSIQPNHVVYIRYTSHNLGRPDIGRLWTLTYSGTGRKCTTEEVVKRKFFSLSNLLDWTTLNFWQ